MAARRGREHDVTLYARRVIAGKEPAGHLVGLACERHLRDIKDGPKRGLHFVPDAADHAFRFFSFLRHSKGEWAGEPFEPSLWQRFGVGSVFGWLRDDGLRRFRTSYTSVARKNGKSTEAAGVGLYMMTGDGEPGPEIYSAATKRDQSKIVFEEAKRMVRSSPALKKRIGVHANNMHMLATAAKFEPLSSEANSMDGLNIHAALIDELHAHKTRAVWDVLETATGARRQPLIFVITTAGYDRHSICWEVHDYSVKVLEGIIEDDTWFAYVAALDDDDDWTDPDNWAKANPNLNVSVKLEDLARKADKARHMPAAQNAFRRLHCNQWTEQADRWMDIELWDACDGTVDPAALEGRQCFGGLDLASTTDIAALVLLFPMDDGLYEALCHFWVPAENIQERARRDRVPYDQWARDGLIKATEGNVIDFDVIRADVNALGDLYDIAELAIDRWNATQITTQLMGDGFTVVPFGQGFASMTAPTKELMRIVLDERLNHGANAVLRWMASNVAVAQDAADNWKPDKAKSTERIDGIVALVMALGRAMVRDEGGSVYDNADFFI